MVSSVADHYYTTTAIMTSDERKQEKHCPMISQRLQGLEEERHGIRPKEKYPLLPYG